MTGVAVYAQSTVGDQVDVMEHAGLVKRIANHMISRLPAGVQIDDLIQAGLIALMEAAKQYDPSQGASFETYATIRVRGAMLDEVRHNNWAPRSVFRKARLIASAVRDVENKQGRDARPAEVAEALRITLDEYYQMLSEANCHAVLSIDASGCLEHASERDPDPYQQIEDQEFKRALAAQISGLPERERLVLALYYDEELNLREIGEVLGVSESRVCQIHSQATLRLRARMEDWFDQD